MSKLADALEVEVQALLTEAEVEPRRRGRSRLKARKQAPADPTRQEVPRLPD